MAEPQQMDGPRSRAAEAILRVLSNYRYRGTDSLLQEVAMKMGISRGEVIDGLAELSRSGKITSKQFTEWRLKR